MMFCQNGSMNLKYMEGESYHNYIVSSRTLSAFQSLLKCLFSGFNSLRESSDCKGILKFISVYAFCT